MPMAESMDLSSLCCGSKHKGECFIFFCLWVCLFWMNGLKWFSQWRMDMWEVHVFLSPDNSYLASGTVLLAWFFTLPSYQCKSKHSFRDWIILLKGYWCVELVWNHSLATHVSSLGVRKELNASMQKKQSLQANPVPCLRLQQGVHCPQVGYQGRYVNLC